MPAVTTPPLPLFHVAKSDGSTSGPHHAGFIRKGLASGELTPETPVSLKGAEDWLPLSEFTADLEMPTRIQESPPQLTAGGPSRRGIPVRGSWGVVFAVGTVALSIPASVFLHRGMPAAGFACLLAMTGCLVAAMRLLDPLRK